MFRLVGEDVKSFMEKYGFKDKGLKCINCGEPAVYNECFYIKGYACLRFKHDCPEKYWTATLKPISEEEKDFWFGVV